MSKSKSLKSKTKKYPDTRNKKRKIKNELQPVRGITLLNEFYFGEN